MYSAQPADQCARIPRTAARRRAGPAHARPAADAGGGRPVPEGVCSPSSGSPAALQDRGGHRHGHLRTGPGRDRSSRPCRKVFLPAHRDTVQKPNVRAHAVKPRGQDGRRSRPAGTACRQPAVERGQVHPAGRGHRHQLPRDGYDIVIAVHDTAIGVPQDEQPQLFTRFFRSSISMERETQGTGLGLFIVQHVAQAHGGAVTMVSAPGAGSTFTVRLPARRVLPA